MKKDLFLPIIIIVLFTILFFHAFFLQGKLPIPSDTIIGLYHPFIDFAVKHFPNGVPVKNTLITDPVRQQYPWRWLAVSTEMIGQLPLWNPYNFAGTPLLANLQSAAFYPLNILLFIFPFWLGWSIMVFLQPILAGLFLFFYLRRMKVSVIASLLGGFIFSYCGFSIAWLEWNVLVQVAIWLPLILLAKEHLLEKTSYKWMAILIFAQCAAFFAGFIQIFFYMILLHESYLLARIITITRTENRKTHFLNRVWKKYTPFIIQDLIIIGITSIQWLPTLQLIIFSNRNSDLLNVWKLPGWFIPWQNLAQFFAPDFFGNPTTLNYWGIWNYGEFIGYVGIFPLIMILFALFYRRDKKTFFFGAFLLISLIFSLPTIFAKIPYITGIPFFSASQPTRLLFITDFSLSILSALGLDYYVRNSMSKKIIYPLLLIFIVFSGLWYFALSAYKLFHISLNDSLVTKHNLYFPTALFFLSAILLSSNFYIKNIKIKNFLIVVLLVLTFIDLYRFSNKFISFTQKSFLFPQTDALSYLQKQQGQFRIMATSSEILPPNFSIMYQLQSLDGYDPLYLQRYGEFISALSQNKPDITLLDFHRIITPQNLKSRLIDLLGVRYILTLTNPHDSNLKKVFSEGKTIIYKNSQAFSRVFFVQSVKSVTDKDEAVRVLFDPQINLHKTAIVEGWGNQSTHFANGSALITNYQANSITITTRSNNRTFLVLTDTYYPTWHMKIDGREGKIYRTDYNFRGIVLPAGNHQVIFYDTLL